MPNGGKKLSNESLAALKDWIDLGAPYSRSLLAVKPAGHSLDRKVVASRRRILVVPTSERRHATGCEARFLDPDPHRFLHAGSPRGGGYDPQPARYAPPAHPAGNARSARPAANARRNRYLRQRYPSRCVRPPGRSPSGQSALRRTVGPILARPGSIRREPRVRA